MKRKEKVESQVGRWGKGRKERGASKGSGWARGRRGIDCRTQGKDTQDNRREKEGREELGTQNAVCLCAIRIYFTFKGPSAWDRWTGSIAGQIE